MITVTSDSFHEKVRVLDEEIILNGPPSDLQGNIHFDNTQEESLRVKGLALVDKNKKRVGFKGRDSIQLYCKLQPGEKKLQNIYHNLPADTPPGTYESFLMVGDEMRKVKMIVQPNIEIEIQPSFFTFNDTTPCTTHIAVLTLTNTGNLPFQIPDLKHAATLDMDMICRAFGVGFREKKAVGLMETLDEVTQNLKKHLTEWADISIRESGQVVIPGNNLLMHLHITLPDGADARMDYSGSIRFWDHDIGFIIKSHKESKTEKRNGKEK